MGEVIALAEVARARRVRARRSLHATCCRLLAIAVEVARSELSVAPPNERPVRVRRLRKLAELEAYATAIG